ncbi:MAG: hypothetical protein HY331_14510 [Chloroflexi bacterium]|nr:hypothetical protein [Chloroflexota bacterium]
MDEIDFQMGGERVRLSRQQVIERMKHETPEPIQTWAVEVAGRLFPVKQVLATSTGKSRADFISHRARDILRQLDFRVFDVTREPVPSPTTENGVGDDDAMRIRLAVLPLAVQWAANHPGAGVADVLQAAEAFDTWITRG